MTKGAMGGQTWGRPLRIAMISQYLPSGSKIGVGYWVDQLGRSLCRRGHEVTIFTACPAMQDAPYRTKTISLSGALRTFRFAVALRREGLERFDVLHAHGDDYLLWGRRPAAHVRTMHGSCFAEALHIRGPKERARMLALGVTELLATAVADRTFVVSPATRAWMPWVRGVLPCGVDRLRFGRAESVALEQVPTVLFVGTWHQRKRGALLAEAFQRHVLPVLPEARLWMVAEDCPGGPGIVPIGRVSDDALVELYGRAWVFCLPSSYEGLGIPYVEALAAGLPVVATPNPGSRYVLDDGRAGWIVGEEDLGPALLRLLTDPAERARLAEAGRRRSAEFDLERVVDHYERTYRELLERGRASRSFGPELAKQGMGSPPRPRPPRRPARRAASFLAGSGGKRLPPRWRTQWPS
jgi:phosphatidylinositol alpha-mannosyltransferase